MVVMEIDKYLCAKVSQPFTTNRFSKGTHFHSKGVIFKVKRLFDPITYATRQNFVMRRFLIKEFNILFAKYY